MNNGALVHDDYKKLFDNKNVFYDKFLYSQIQPSSIDLTLSNECYEITSSFLSSNSKVKDRITPLITQKIDLDKKFVFKKNKTYLVRLNEKLDLPKNVFGKCNPKSSTGRLDIFCRTILNHCDEYEKIPLNYSGDIFLEITSRSFDVKFAEGDSLNQMRLIFDNHDYINDESLTNMHNSESIVYNASGKKIYADISSGLKISVDLDKKNNINAYVAKKETPILIFNKIKCHKISEFWDLIKTNNSNLMIEKDRFYILKSKEKIRIPINMAGEMIPYDTGIGDFRVHYAGFFDPGFGDPDGSYAVMEVKTNEVPFILEDEQVIARIKYEKLNKKSKVVYGSSIKSNYQNQGLALSKHFDVSKD